MSDCWGNWTDEDYSQWDRRWGETNAEFADRKRREHTKENTPKYDPTKQEN